MAEDKSHKIQRPIPQRENEKLRANLSAPDILNPANPSFPVEDIVSSNLQPQKSSYFDNVIKPSVVMNGERIDVPLIYGSPERWKSVQRDGYYRDKEGKIQTPIIMFKRNSVEKRRDLGNKMDANNPQLYYTFQT